MKVTRTGSDFQREPLKGPFGFKGRYLNELWQIAVSLESESGHKSVGLGCQSVLWSDPDVFSAHSQSASNALMYILTEYALNKTNGEHINDPVDFVDKLIPVVNNYAKKVTGNKNLRKTFTLNALVALDNALWILFSKENGIVNFKDLIPLQIRSQLSYKHEKLAVIPLISYNMPIDDITSLVDQGNSILKIKIGSDPENDGSHEKMLEWDKKRLSSIHELAKNKLASFTGSGNILYYLDANGRYKSKDQLIKLIEHADRIGALERIVIFEEPFPEDYECDVSDIPLRFAADESAHTDKDAIERIEMGYKAIALKPIAKTLSMSFKICEAVLKRGATCFCADLTVNPILVDWNKNVAARLPPIPGMKTGVLESNGIQNYRDWERLKSYHPCHDASWINAKGGIFTLDDDFYKHSGGIFYSSKHYESLLQQ